MTYKEFHISSSDTSTKARTGTLMTKSGSIPTPCFAPDATYGAVKHLSYRELEDVKLDIILANVYHLNLRPGAEIIQQLGGLHHFMHWDKPIITDSGGWQALSLVYRHKMGKITDVGVVFHDHLSGSRHLLTPQSSIEAQLKMDSDILMVLDYPVDHNASASDNQRSVELTTNWAKISKETFEQNPLSTNKILYGIVQGAGSKEMRQKSFEELSRIGFDGYGYGGPPVNKDVVEFTANLIPPEKFKYMMGSGTPREIVEFVGMGYDMFDCVVPTRNARHGLLYTWQGEIRITNKQYQLDQDPIEQGCGCFACQNYTRAYIRHLLRVGEPLGQRLTTIHNLYFYTALMEKIRDSITKSCFSQLKQDIQNFYPMDDPKM
jgi:queuine tRNA-ribosyltransferase